ncbi:MAG: ABC transporter permease, partial [Ginsengibacter sp.]
MFRNYFKAAWRNLVNNKFYSAINITGLAIGLAVGIMILLWVQDELSYDSFHHNAGSIYKINSHLGTGTSAQVWEGSPGPLAVFSKQQIPEVVNAVRINKIYEQMRFTYQDKKFAESKLAYVDSTFFSMFDFRLLEGNAAKPFPNMNSIIVNSSEAKKYFGAVQSAVGKQLITDNGNFTVSGVMEDFPENSSMKYNMLLPMSFYAGLFTKHGGNGDWKTMDEDLGNFYFDTYLQIQKGGAAETAGKKLTKIYLNKRGEDVKDDFFTLQPLKTIHLVAADGNGSALQAVRIFLIVAILILFIACINYVNLSTARSMVRAKEVSVRKIIGAARAQLFIQFIVESVLLFLFASIFAFFIIFLLLPLYNDLSGKHLVFSLGNRGVWIVVGSAIIGTLALSGIYPALLLSSFKPIQALRGKLSFGIGNASFRKILVVTQFIFSVGLISATIIISYQLRYIRDKDLGFDKEYVFSFGLGDQMHSHYDAARNELLKQPGVLGVAASGNSIVGTNSTTGDTYWDGKEPDRMFLIHTNGIDKNLIPLLKMQMVAGNNFSGSKSDSAHFILNETAVKQAGITNPVGKNFTLWQNKGTIIGVVKDFNYASLKQAIEPSIFYYDPSGSRMYIKTTGKDASKAITASQKRWKEYTADVPFSYSFLDDDFNSLYQSDQTTGFLFNVFAIVAIAISCLGLFGLATYTAQVKTKEIGIRKVLGASIASITNLLAKEFIMLVLVAFIIAAPVAWFAMNKWLQDFAYRINISWWMFVLAGLVAVLIALVTVSFQAIKA